MLQACKTSVHVPARITQHLNVSFPASLRHSPVRPSVCRNCRDKIPDALLFRHQACLIPQDCKVSTWSPLRPHNSSCVGPGGVVVPGFMKQTREVLQLPMGEGLACPPNLLEFVQLHGEDPTKLRP